MSTHLFHLARNLKFSRFTIDVLTQRLEQLNSLCPEEYEPVLTEAKRGVQHCEHLHDELRDRLSGAQPLDAGSIASLLAAFDELNRGVKELLAQCNAFDF
jgi:hypothetical protein